MSEEVADKPHEAAAAVATTRRARALTSLGTKLALAVVIVLGMASAIIGVTLSERARASVIESKTMATSMMVELFSASVAPVLDFDDEEALRAGLGNLKANKDVLYAAVWKEGQERPAAEFGVRPAVSSRPSGSHTEILKDHIEYSRPIADPHGRVLGTAIVHMSLAGENAEARRLQRRIVVLSMVVAAAIAALVIAVARQQVLTPLNRLAKAAKRLEGGERVQVEVRSADEVGNLGRAFNAMAEAIADREQRLEALNRRQQELFDHMRQAVVVVGDDGVLDEVRSRHALEMLGATSPDREIIWDQDSIRRRASELGLDANARPADLVLAHGLTTREAVGDLAGHGVGLSAVKSELDSVGYAVELEWQAGAGTTVTLRPTARSAPSSGPKRQTLAPRHWTSGQS